jgi:hypothetical protein
MTVSDWCTINISKTTAAGLEIRYCLIKTGVLFNSKLDRHYSIAAK